MPTKSEIIAACETLRKALEQTFGDDARTASAGEGFAIEVRCTGIDLTGEASELVIDDGEPADLADMLISLQQSKA